MSHSYDPRRLLRQISNQLLRALFARHNMLQDLRWDEMTETRIETVFAAWQKLPDAKRKEIQVVLQDVHALADGRGLRVFAEEIHRRFPDRAKNLLRSKGVLIKRCGPTLPCPMCSNRRRCLPVPMRSWAAATG